MIPLLDREQRSWKAYLHKILDRDLHNSTIHYNKKERIQKANQVMNGQTPVIYASTQGNIIQLYEEFRSNPCCNMTDFENIQLHFYLNKARQKSVANYMISFLWISRMGKPRGTAVFARRWVEKKIGSEDQKAQEFTKEINSVVLVIMMSHKK